MPIKVRCPLCGGEVQLYGEQHGQKESIVERGYFCTHCDYKFFVDEDGNISGI